MNGIAIFTFFMALMLTQDDSTKGNASSFQSTQETETNQETPEYMAEGSPETVGQTRDRIVSAQFECYLKIISDPPYGKEGSYCNRTWDGWLCWDDASAKSMSAQHCPDYYQVFDPAEKATKICTENGKWYRHPSSNRIWTNYTQCTAQTMGQVKTVWNLYYSAITGHVISIICLLLALSIFCYFKSLSCQRISLHKNLFVSYILNSIVSIIWLQVVANNQDLISRNPVDCKVLNFIHLYLTSCTYFWMLCEGIYLHTLIIVAVFVEQQQLFWYYILGWGFPLIPAIIHAAARSKYFNDNCWISSGTHLLYIIHGPICTALLVNLFFLLNIVRVLITKLRVTHQAQSKAYMKVVRATLILVPLLGIQYVLVPAKPKGHITGEIYEHVMHICLHYQAIPVTTIFCFYNGEVQSAFKRQWSQYKVQCSHQLTSTDISHSNATSVTEIARYLLTQPSNSNHLNSKSCPEAAAVKVPGLHP
ncbi:calcitonin gene-related peptide type 1 receptor-like isoform X1 [Hemiscyllium ocellatum]|uniref:calcitonin gene-related peptide type 1 receptor-like isoform X1 n=2 Tax=Hemiscyllium ocellatum TaxID=170820 RepID=UPI002966C6F4|nr:calcitonin gene-related peptide type 1 receptor-like isoform X1 [Hemiscyllium ocellatum]XP_060676983.1 calcitonin gene-related peptide type 1 receptor-like isoform X1 [Hemiscyllium ocellatum]